jgi:hypothetical protein
MLGIVGLTPNLSVKFALIFVSYFVTIKCLKMPNYLISLIGMAAIVTVSAVICGYLMHLNDKDHE